MLSLKASPETLRRYRDNVFEFDVVLQYLDDSHDSLRGFGPSQRKQEYCERILKKMILHCRAMRALAPNPVDIGADREWDPSTMAAIARCIIQTRDAFVYFAEPLLSHEEDSFRLSLWDLHGRQKRQRLFELTHPGVTSSNLTEFKKETERRKGVLFASDRFAKIESQIRNRIKSAQTPFRYKESELSARFSVNENFYLAAILNLSQSIHTLPEEVNDLINFQAGSDDGLRVIANLFMYTAAFMSQTAVYCRSCFGRMIKIPTGNARYIIKCQLDELSEGWK